MGEKAEPAIGGQMPAVEQAWLGFWIRLWWIGVSMRNCLVAVLCGG